MFADYAKIAWASLRKRSLRSWLTMLGIFIGIAAVISLISLGQGMQDAINSQFASVGTDKVIVQGASPGFGPPGELAVGVIDDHDLRLIRKVPGVSRAAGRVVFSTTVEYAESSKVLISAGLAKDPDSRDLLIESINIKIADGRELKSSEKKKLMVGYNLWAGKTFDKPVVVGTKLLINGEKFQVVGLLEKIGAGRDDMIIMNEADMRELKDSDEYSAIFAQVVKGEDPAVVADKILRAMRRDRHQKEGFEDVTAETSQEMIDSINTILGVVQAVFIGIAAISLLVGGIGIMNTMYTAVMERTREIGIMKAIGARNVDVLLLFLIESGLLGMTGGAIGVLLGMGLSKVVEFVAKGVIGDLLKPSFPWYLIVGALLFSFSIGVISGVFPARQASKLQPVEALRE